MFAYLECGSRVVSVEFQTPCSGMNLVGRDLGRNVPWHGSDPRESQAGYNSDFAEYRHSQWVRLGYSDGMRRRRQRTQGRVAGENK